MICEAPEEIRVSVHQDVMVFDGKMKSCSRQVKTRGALDNDEEATAKLYVQKAAQAADEAGQQTVGGTQGPGFANPTIASLPSNTPAAHLRMTATAWTSQRPGRTDSVRRSSKRSLVGSPIGLVSCV